MKIQSTRRHFVQRTATALGLLPLAGLESGSANPAVRPLKILCVGGHPDDPESGCGGTLAKFTAAGHELTILYLTRGEAGISGKSAGEAAEIRSKEAIAACAILKAKPVFAGQVDGSTVINNDWVGRIRELIKSEKPSLVFTHWPIDSHKDHQVASLLTIQAWMSSGDPFELYFFEVCTGEQTMGFRPTDYVDITDQQELKKKSVFCHQSQDPPGIYNCGHAAMEQFRGMEIGVHAAEAFVHMSGRQKENPFGLNL
jgi:LmbE family N-acetylglucosaminyl deacetylase